MMDSSPDLLGLGSHCSVGSCRQIDFLPFKCDCCNLTFCLDHRSYSAHACSKAGAKETTVIVCPLCAKSVLLKLGQDANTAFDEHIRSGCDPSNYARVHKKPKCPVTGCKEKLTTITAYSCKKCGQRVCLKHRLPSDHSCEEVQASNRHRGSSSIFASLRGGPQPATPAPTSSARTPSPAAPAPAPPRRPNPSELRAAAAKQYDDPANSVRGTAARRMTGGPPHSQPAPPGPARPTSAAPAPASNANPLVPPHRPERCPQCGAAFESVARLIQHVEDFHPSGSARGNGADGADGGNGLPPGAYSGPGSAAGAGAGGVGGFISNPLQGLTGLLGGTTIAGGAAPAAPAAPAGYGSVAAVAAAGAWGRGNGGGGGGGLLQSGAGAGGGEVYRCYFCSRSFGDPVELVGHADRCTAARAAAGGGAGRGAAAGGSGGAKDSCVVS